MPNRLDPLDHRLLDEFQRGFPLVQRPFAVIARALDVDEATVISRLLWLRLHGFISRVGATIRPNTAGASTLAAMRVPEGRIDEVAGVVGAETGVNHSYLREDDWNLWFVATAPDSAELEGMLSRISDTTGLRVLNLRLLRPFNIDLGFRLTGKTGAATEHRNVPTEAVAAEDRPLLQALTTGLPLVSRPFDAVAAELGQDEDWVLERLRVHVASGIISRLGVIVHHRALGWNANAMLVWELPEACIPQAGRVAAAHPGVTLCYQRRSVPDVWPYTLYNMIHARAREEALAVVESLRVLPEFHGVPHRVLFSTRCFKQHGAFLHRKEVAA